MFDATLNMLVSIKVIQGKDLKRDFVYVSLKIGKNNAIIGNIRAY